MTKKEYLKKLKKKINWLCKYVRDAILDDVIDRIDNQVLVNKISESEAIQTLEPMDDIIAKYVAAYKDPEVPRSVIIPLIAFCEVINVCILIEYFITFPNLPNMIFWCLILLGNAMFYLVCKQQGVWRIDRRRIFVSVYSGFILICILIENVTPFLG